MTHITRARFQEVFDGKYCRLSSLRQLVIYYKAAALKDKERKGAAEAVLMHIDIKADSVRLENSTRN